MHYPTQSTRKVERKYRHKYMRKAIALFMSAVNSAILLKGTKQKVTSCIATTTMTKTTPMPRKQKSNSLSLHGIHKVRAKSAECQ